MNVTAHRRQYSKDLGRQVELKFKQAIESRGHIVKESSEEENIYGHIDFWINNQSVDVKGFRHLECIWLELQNVNGNDGWLKSKVDYIAFDVVEMNAFCIFKRSDLLEFINDNVIESTDNSRDYMKFYTRSKWDRKDKIVKVKFEHIRHLLLQIIDYATT